MDPISIIVTALVTGASAALKDTATQAVKDSYQGLKSLVVHHWTSGNKVDVVASENQAKVLLSQLEQEDAEFYQVPVEKTLGKIMPEPDVTLIKQAQALLALVDEDGTGAGKYQVSVSNSQGVQIGDNNLQNNTFS